MFIWNWKKEILTLPNLLSLFRLILIPVYVFLYLRAQTRQEFVIAAGVMAFSCLTDVFDGVIARRFHMISHVGKILDPLADKLTQLSLFLCLSVKYPLLYPVLVLFVIKELFQLFALVIHYRMGKALPGALAAGKICSFILFSSFIILVSFPEMDGLPADLMILTDAVFLLLSLNSYIQAYYGKNRKIRDLENE